MEDWGYRFVGQTAIEQFIRDLEGSDALAEYPDFNERRNHANKLMSDLFGGEFCWFYVRRKGSGKEPGEQKWELTIATDRNDAKLPAMLDQREKTLRLLAAVSENGSGGLRLLSAHLRPREQGQKDGFTVPCHIRLLPDHQHWIGVPRKALERMANVPFCGDHLPTEEQLQAWQVFVEIERRIAEKRQFCVPFLSHNYGSATRRIAFEIDAAEATIDGSPENSLDEEDFWNRAFQARNEDLKFFKSSPEGKSGRDGDKLGRIAEVDSELGKIRVMLDSDLVERMTEGHYQLPATGFLFFEAFGEINQIKHKERALKDLQDGRTQNPYLGEFFFDASQARSPQQIVKLQPQDLLLPEANPDQIAAVEAALSAPDLVLIQGPPGTGKTTVIAEICYQVALRGGRTLIASQANLAVDNALSRLVHNPVIRTLRKGKAEKVQEEGEPFLEDNVIGTWLQNTAGDCENGLAKRREKIEIFRKLLTSSERFAGYLREEETLEQSQQKLQECRATLEANCRTQEIQQAEAEAQQRDVESLIPELDSLLASAPSVNWGNSVVANFLPRLKPYVDDDSSVQNFVANVRMARDLATELGFALPARGAFGLAAWLRESLAAWLSEAQTAFAYANEAAIAMSEAETIVKVFRQHDAHLQQLKRTYQQPLANQKIINSKISNFSTIKSEIGLVTTEVQSWLSTAHSRLYKILNHCLLTHQPFTYELIQLPVRLQAIAQAVNSQLVLPEYGTNSIDYLPDWGLLKKALDYEKESGFDDLIGKNYRFSEFLHRSLSQPLMVLSTNDHEYLQETAEEFRDYRSLPSEHRQNLVRNTRSFLEKMQRVYGTSWEPNNIDSTLNRIAQEVKSDINTSVCTWLKQVQAKTEQELQVLEKQLNEQTRLLANQHQTISATQEQVEIARREVNLKVQRVLQLLQEITHLAQVPEKLRTLAEQYIDNHSDIWENAPNFSAQLRSCENNISQLEALISSLEPFAVLSTIQTRLQTHLSALQQASESSKVKFKESQKQLCEVEIQLEQQEIPETLIAERSWWKSVWREIPDNLKRDVSSTELFHTQLLRQFKLKFDTWQQELEKEEMYLNRYQDLVQDWIEKLRNPSAQDRNDLRRIYLDNANVIGITCVQAARGDFSKEFKNFDVVIIDEVSKCTPPELLIPALKGNKLVLVGDHRQLPPMLNDNTIEEIAREMESTTEELSFLEESLFKIQFEAAAQSIKRMLTIQYRMHPNIMGAINQFYEHQLKCGIPEPNRKRAHNLASSIIQENHHLLWLKMPLGQGFEEQKEGTSPFNIREVDVIERLCHQMEAAWSAKVAEGQLRKQIGIITFYGAQLRVIEERIDPKLFPSLHIRTGTVDRFQGMERQVVIVSMVRNNPEKKVGFAKKPERVNVAFSRAQELLVIVGCHSLFTEYAGKVGSMYSEVSNVVRYQGGLVDVSSILG
jgi:hypothetical protein